MCSDCEALRRVNADQLKRLVDQAALKLRVAELEARLKNEKPHVAELEALVNRQRAELATLRKAPSLAVVK